MKPARTLLFLLAVLLLLAIAGWSIPAAGLRIGELLTLHLPAPQEVLFASAQEKVDISDILSVPTDAEDTSAVIALNDTLAADTATAEMPAAPAFDPAALPPLEERIAMHFPEAGKNELHTFFSAISRAGKSKQPVRIMHYGDSQVEGDRITAYVRNKLQTQFGGQGPGLVSVADIVPHFSVDRTLNGEWKRYSVMGRRDSTQHHKRFGAMSSFSRFTPILADSILPDPEDVRSAAVVLRPNKRSYARARDWTVCRLYFGWHRSPITIELTRDGELVSTETFEPADHLLTREWRFPKAPGEVAMTFTGADSPDVLGISLEGTHGVVMDNIAARGGAGYEFRTVDQSLLKAMYDHLGTDLLVLQYGGNVLPHMKSAEEAAQYGRFFGAQIARFRKLIPGVSIVVVGPSDMSIKEGDLYVTRPYLEEVRDALKENTLKQGAVFWDMYAAMGGRGSMVSWVEADPPLAATDYTHFSPAGARKVGELFYTAMISEYAEWLANAPATMKNSSSTPQARTKPASPSSQEKAASPNMAHPSKDQ